MATLFLDSFDHYATADILTKWTTASGLGTGNTQVAIVSGGRTANRMQFLSARNFKAWATFNITASQNIFLGFALLLDSTTEYPALICSFKDSAGTSNANAQIGIQVNSDLTLAFCNNSNTIIGTKSTATITLGTWCYIEVGVQISNSVSASTCNIKLNGTTIVTLPAATNTRGASSNNWADYISFSDSNNDNGVKKFWIDDLYCNDSTGSTANTFLGDITVDALFTSSVGTYQDFSVTGAGTSVLATTDRAQDGDSTYVSSNNAGDRESFHFTSPTFSIISVYAVQLLNYAKKVGTGNRGITPFTRTSITNYEQTSAAISTSYGYQRQIVQINPATGLAWTETEIQGIEAGVKVS